MGQRFEFAVELELALLEGPSQMNQESVAEEATEDLDGKEERFSARDPARVVGADSAAGHYARSKSWVNLREPRERVFDILQGLVAGNQGQHLLLRRNVLGPAVQGTGMMRQHALHDV